MGWPPKWLGSLFEHPAHPCSGAPVEVCQQDTRGCSLKGFNALYPRQGWRRLGGPSEDLGLRARGRQREEGRLRFLFPSRILSEQTP